jgi:hypothetical protein
MLSDWQYHAYNGISTVREEGANTDLRAVLATRIGIQFGFICIQNFCSVLPT